MSGTQMKVALITGGSRGIGRAMVEEFTSAGYAVAFTYAASTVAAEALAAQVGKKGGTVLSFHADVRDFTRAQKVVEETRSALGPIDVLVNNAGIRRDRALANMDPEVWREVIDTNLSGTFHYARACIGEMIRSGGVILNVTSVSGATGMAGQTNYSASKAGIIGFTRSLAKEVARFGVRVNAIAPGYIDTDMTASIEEPARKKLYAQVPMGRAGQPRDVARLALYLAGDDASYITGQVFTMDGGLT
jgi:3-oxoacyl-[acyl-carrier protein] reductase